jgi:hypothetical protein
MSKPPNFDPATNLDGIIIGMVGPDFTVPYGKHMFTDSYWKAIAEDSALDSWIVDLRKAETNARQLRLRLEALQGDSSLSCQYCETEFYGRKGAKYCSPSHRALASRAAKKLI